MRRKDKEINSRDEIDEIISKAEALRLGLAGKSGPYVVALNYAYCNGIIYFHCAPAGKKIEMIKEDPRVCIQIDLPGGVVGKGGKPCSIGYSYRSVVAFGKARFVEEIAEKNIALQAITKKYSGLDYSFSKQEMQGILLIGIDLDSVTGKRSG